MPEYHCPDLLPISMLAWAILLVEHCTSITEVKGLNPIQAVLFQAFLFTTAKVGSITAINKINPEQVCMWNLGNVGTISNFN